MSAPPPLRRFTLLRELGAGARGPLHLAEMRLADGGTRLVALRMLPVRREEHPARAAQLREQLRHLGWIRHAGFAAVDDVVSVDGQIAVVSDYLEGIGLDLLLDHLRSRAAPMPLRAALELVGRLAASLDAAWRRASFEGGPPLQLVHGDVRPANVRVDDAGGIKLVDTGVAGVLHDVPGRPSPFPPAYLAPERARGRAPDRFADVYGLGATLIDLLSLNPLDRPRVRSDAHARLIGERAQAIAAAAGGDAALGALVVDLCAFEPSQRPEPQAAADRCRLLARRIPDEGFAAWAERVVPVALSVGLARVRAPNPLGEMLLVEDEPVDGAFGDTSDPFGLFGGDLAAPAASAGERVVAAPPVPRPRPAPLNRKPVADPLVFPVRVAEPAPAPERTEDLPTLELTGEVSLSLEFEPLESPERTESTDQGPVRLAPVPFDLNDLTEGLDPPDPAAPSAWDEAPTRQDEVRALMKARLGPVDPTSAEWTEEIVVSGSPDPTRSDPVPPDPSAPVPVERTTDLAPRRRPAATPFPPVVAVVESTDARIAERPSTEVFSAEGAVIRPRSTGRAARRERGGIATASLMAATTALFLVLGVLVHLVAARLGR